MCSQLLGDIRPVCVKLSALPVSMKTGCTTDNVRSRRERLQKSILQLLKQ